jgi:uncharacterized protein
MWLATLALASSDEIANPRTAGGWIADPADVVPAEVEARVNTRIDALHRDLDAEIAVVVAPSDGGSPDDLALTLFDAWGIGDAQADNGLLMLVVGSDPASVRIHAGAGLAEVLPTEWVDHLEATITVDGIDDAVAQIDARLREHPDQARMGVGSVSGALDPQLRDTLAREFARLQATRTVVVTVLLMVALVGTVSAFGYAVARVRAGERTCPTCRVYMPMLSEADDDQHLTAGQVTEEQVGAVDYQVHQCPKCGQTRTFVVHQFWTPYVRCPQCTHRTRVVDRTTRIPAAPGVDGLDEIRESCAHCDYSSFHTRSTPALRA